MLPSQIKRYTWKTQVSSKTYLLFFHEQNSFRTISTFSNKVNKLHDRIDFKWIKPFKAEITSKKIGKGITMIFAKRDMQRQQSWLRCIIVTSVNYYDDCDVYVSSVPITTTSTQYTTGGTKNVIAKLENDLQEH